MVMLQDRVVLVDKTYPTTDPSLVLRFVDLAERDHFHDWWTRFGAQHFAEDLELEMRSRE